MGRKLTTNAQATPVVNVTETVGSFVQGVLRERKEVKTQWGMRPVFGLELEDSDMRFMTKGDKGLYIEIKEVAQGSLVSIFAPTLLDRALQQATAGDKVKIVYSGVGKAKKGRNAPHMFDVEII